jgi:hypothetical protein
VERRKRDRDAQSAASKGQPKNLLRLDLRVVVRRHLSPHQAVVGDVCVRAAVGDGEEVGRGHPLDDVPFYTREGLGVAG